VNPEKGLRHSSTRQRPAKQKKTAPMRCRFFPAPGETASGMDVTEISQNRSEPALKLLQFCYKLIWQQGKSIEFGLQPK